MEPNTKGKGSEHRARDMSWSPALPMGTALEGGEGGELNAGGGRRWNKRLGEGRVRRCSESFIKSVSYSDLAHRILYRSL